MANYYSAKSVQPILQDLLMKTGWLVPNLEASPPFYLAGLEGKLLNKLDLQFLVDQILLQVKIVKEKGKVELTLGLRPENLGEILLTLTSKSGMVSIQIQAPEETRKLIEAELKELELALKKAKVNLAGIKILATKEVGKDA
ncbi:MAG: flagellar hook-length control protein FliK [Candidatus Margulisiibacteriota bacterium]